MSIDRRARRPCTRVITVANNPCDHPTADARRTQRLCAGQLADDEFEGQSCVPPYIPSSPVRKPRPRKQLLESATCMVQQSDSHLADASVRACESADSNAFESRILGVLIQLCGISADSESGHGTECHSARKKPRIGTAGCEGRECAMRFGRTSSISHWSTHARRPSSNVGGESKPMQRGPSVT